MAVDWSYFNQYEDVDDRYLPDSGEGDNMATQIVTAVTKLVYKWYNDGDVYDNNYGLEGFANDLSSYANWLYKHVPASKYILTRIFTCGSEDEYEEILKDLVDSLWDLEDLERWAKEDKVGSIYDCDGPFEFNEYDDEDEDDYYDEDEDEDDYDEDEDYEDEEE